MTATRHNQGKSRVDLIVPQTIRDLGFVMGFGAQKYDDNNWKLSCNTDDHDAFVRGCHASAMRHLLQIADGEYMDQESGLPHTAHVAANAMFIQYYYDHDQRRQDETNIETGV